MPGRGVSAGDVSILIGAAGRAVSGVGGRGKGPGDFTAPRLSLT